MSSQDKKVEESNTKTDIKPSVKKDISEPEIVEVDWSKYFNDLNGAAVFYDVSEKKHMIYNKELAFTQNSPCSTFKIVSSLIALEKGIIQPDDSVHTWSGEIFWNEQWNRDINFEEALKTSCVWYFREVIDEIGKETIQEQLNKLQYGNCDISDWEGYLNTNNNNRTLTGFWIESSLKISPKEQVEVMKRVFGEHSVYSKNAQDELKKVMFVTEESQTDVYIYGKTGMGKVQGILADAWFTGFAEHEGRKIYFCVYLGKNEDKNVSSSVAKEIAIQMIHDYCIEK